MHRNSTLWEYFSAFAFLAYLPGILQLSPLTKSKLLGIVGVQTGHTSGHSTSRVKAYKSYIYIYISLYRQIISLNFTRIAGDGENIFVGPTEDPMGGQ